APRAHGTGRVARQGGRENPPGRVSAGAAARRRCLRRADLGDRRHLGFLPARLFARGGSARAGPPAPCPRTARGGASGREAVDRAPAEMRLPPEVERTAPARGVPRPVAHHCRARRTDGGPLPRGSRPSGRASRGGGPMMVPRGMSLAFVLAAVACARLEGEETAADAGLVDLPRVTDV